VGRRVYEIERQAKANGFVGGQLLRLRQDLAVSILDQFQKWLGTERAAVLPKSPMGEAIGYALRNWQALARYGVPARRQGARSCQRTSSQGPAATTCDEAPGLHAASCTGPSGQVR
jgi:hypothetical protein